VGAGHPPSSDSLRHARPLRYARTERLPGEFPLELGGALQDVEICYETWGELSPAADNAVLVCHAISGDSHAARHGPDDDPGWWDVVVGPGRPIDTRRWFVVCPNVLGGCRGSTGPGSTDPARGRPYGRRFPNLTVTDMVRAHVRLLDQLGVEQLHAAVGGSLGGHQVLELATRFPERLRGAVAMATSPHLTPQALAFDVVGRNAILRDPHYDADAGPDAPAPDVGLAIARMLGHITYLSREAMMERFGVNRLALVQEPTAFERRFEVGSYLAHQGEKFVERFDAHSYVTLSLAMDLFSLGETREQLVSRLGRSRCRWLLLSFSSDWLFPPFQSWQMTDALLAGGGRVAACRVESRCGHDAFLLEDDVDRYGALVRGFLERLGRPVARDGGGDAVDPTTLYGDRIDYDLVLEQIARGSSVLDLGCGGGELLARLSARGDGRLVGIDRDEDDVITCVERGLDVVHADLEAGLASFADGSFDVVVLSQTLQHVQEVDSLMREMLRVGRRCIVSFPNVAHWRQRQRLAEDGRAPVSSFLGAHRWWDTPDVRSLSIADFEDYCAARSLPIVSRLALDSESGKRVEQDPNRHADVAIFVLGS